MKFLTTGGNGWSGGGGIKSSGGENGSSGTTLQKATWGVGGQGGNKALPDDLPFYIKYGKGGEAFDMWNQKYSGGGGGILIGQRQLVSHIDYGLGEGYGGGGSATYDGNKGIAVIWLDS